MPHNFPHFPDASTRNCVRALLRRADYGEAAIAALFGVATLAEAQSVAGLALPRLPSPPSALAVLVQLFLNDITIAGDTACAALGDAEVAALEASRLVQAVDGGLRPTFRLTPVDGLLIASDRHALHADGCADFVVGPAPVSRTFADLLVRGPVARSLDLGCGSGLLGLQAAAWSQEVVAADINPRAIAFVEFNAELNDLPQVCGAVGDLFAPVGGQRFDRIVCNPPFVISPSAEFVYRDGGTAICRRIIDHAPEHLNPGGYLQMLCNWPEPANGDWRGAIAEWFGDRRCDVWVLRLQHLPAALYASVWLSQEFHGRAIPGDVYAQWMLHLEGLGAGRVGSGLVVMRPAAGRRPWLEMRDAPPSRGPAGASIARVFAARDCLARLEADAAVLDLPLRPIAGLQQRATRQHGNDGWGKVSSELRAGDGFTFGARVDPVLAELVTRLDGRRSLRQLTQDWAEENGLTAVSFLPHLPAAVRQLLLLGLLEPV